MRISSFNDEDHLEWTLPTYKIILLGASSAGKSKLLMRYIYDIFQEKQGSTYGIDCSFVNRKNARFAYYDTAGQQKYRTILNMYFKGSDAAILVYNVNDKQSFKEMKYYSDKIKEEEPDCQLYVVGCKGDLERNVTIKTVETSYPDVSQFTTSAKTGQGVSQVFAVIESQLRRKGKTGRSFMISNAKSYSQLGFNSRKEKVKRENCCY